MDKPILNIRCPKCKIKFEPGSVICKKCGNPMPMVKVR